MKGGRVIVEEVLFIGPPSLSFQVFVNPLIGQPVGLAVDFPGDIGDFNLSKMSH